MDILWRTSTGHFDTASANFSIGLMRPLIVGILDGSLVRPVEAFPLRDAPEEASVVPERARKK